MSYKPPYTISDKILNLVVDITILLSKVDGTFKNDVHLRKKNQIKTVVGTLAIEGNNLDIKQVTAILEGKKVIGSQKEIQEVKSAINTYANIENFDPYKIDDLFKAHSLMMNLLLEKVGNFRDVKVAVKGDVIVHIAPPPLQVPKLMEQLFEWLKNSELNPLITSCIFHYEFEFIHPFADGNGRMGRLWQTLILSRWNPIFTNIPVESLIYQNQKAYYEALQASTDRTDSAPFIEFILQMILDAILDSTQSDQDTAQASDHVTAQAGIHAPQEMSEQVHRLISAMKQEDYTLAELMELLGLTHRATFQKNYLNPAIEAGLIERTIPDKPKSPKQRYRLKLCKT